MATCAGTQNYTLSLTISGSGTFSIDDGVHPVQTGVSAGTIDLGTFPNGAYNVEVTSETVENCFQTVSGSKDCSDNPPPSCDLAVTGTENCIDENSYNVGLTITGVTSYSINDGINTPKTGQTNMNPTVGPFPNGDYIIVITDTNNENCIKTVSGTKDCTDTPPAGLNVN